jgi:hypothetical protein
VDGRRVPVRDRDGDIVRVGPTELGRAVLAIRLEEGAMMAGKNAIKTVKAKIDKTDKAACYAIYHALRAERHAKVAIVATVASAVMSLVALLLAIFS